MPALDVEFILPASYGLGGLDLAMNEPEDFGHQDESFRIKTGGDGEFSLELGAHVYHVDCWILPPVGCFPRNPPAPFLLVRMPALRDEYYAVQTNDGHFSVYTLYGAELTLSEAYLVDLSARSESRRSEDTRTTVGIIDFSFPDE
ncbi:MAG: hypothetical protein JRH19_09455 [Deltaproteobacteria bacterium]|nr:hypothetical protein [Deltaproteobacteria bacterium]